MGLDQVNKVDAAGIERATGHVVLTIADSWDWSDEPAHLMALQKKLFAYLEFIRTGQIVEVYPELAKPRMRIDILARFPIVPSAQALISEAGVLAAELGVDIRWQHFPCKLGDPDSQA